MPRLICFTADPQLWCLKPFEYFMQKYWPGIYVVVAGFSLVPVSYPMVSMGDITDYPFGKWSNAVIDFLGYLQDPLVIPWLEDFWPIRRVDERAVSILAQYMLDHPEVARMDLSTDRLYAGNLRNVGAVEHIDLITNDYPVAYACSLQPGIWRRTELLKVLRPDESPYDFEIAGTRRMEEAKAIVLGTRQSPVKILIAVQQGKLQLDGGYQKPSVVVRPEDIEAIRDYIPPSLLHQKVLA